MNTGKKSDDPGHLDYVPLVLSDFKAHVFYMLKEMWRSTLN